MVADRDRFREFASLAFTAQMVARVIDPLGNSQAFKID
jgi:hypothetical protein